ncbi:MAG: lipoyl(octanoyl) transferase LipB [Gemmatimonadetes bacterium]|jgi:lipoyl(octanoyl) transferase|nr:lipoyl(octanoyl) transferase LipB [Gemmatimonadota bacterium]
MPELLVCDLGTMAYAEALGLQRAMAKARISGELGEDLLLLVEHPPVVTLGRSFKERHLLASPALLANRGVELFEVERGGDVTFHGPGQLVGYPIVDLKRHKRDLHWYLRQVEEALIRGIAPFGLAGERRAGLTGVWTEGRKLASIGVHARDWVTWHGFALNVTTDLRYFDLIVPCGIDAVEMSSIGRELERRGEGAADSGALLATVKARVGAAFGQVFALDVTAIEPAQLPAAAPIVPA